MRLYDFQTDTFVTDRAKIIDALVLFAASALTFSERAVSTRSMLPPESAALLRRALTKNERDMMGLRALVAKLWRAEVMA